MEKENPQLTVENVTLPLRLCNGEPVFVLMGHHIMDPNSTLKAIPGTPAGHTLAASGWFIVGLFYIIAAQYRYYTCRATSTKYISVLDIPLDFLHGRLKTWPAFSILKIATAGSFLGMELVTAMMRAPGGDETPYQQHDVMSAAFVISGVTDMVVVLRRNSKETSSWPTWLPEDIDYTLFSFVSFLMALGLFSHVGGRTPLDVQIHIIMGLLAVFLGVSLLLEATFREHVMLAVLRGYSLLLQGTWIFHLCYKLYPVSDSNTWDLCSHESKALDGLSLAVHLIGNTTLVMIINLAFVWFYYTRTLSGFQLTECNCEQKNGIAMKQVLITDTDQMRNDTVAVTDESEHAWSDNDFETMEPVKQTLN